MQLENKKIDEGINNLDVHINLSHKKASSRFTHFRDSNSSLYWANYNSLDRGLLPSERNHNKRKYER